jgi:hypothetical protein
MNTSGRAMSSLRCLVFPLAMAYLSTPAILDAAPGPTRDTARHLYDRVMDEFRHKEYEAALAGFRLFLKLHGQSIPGEQCAILDR